MWPGGVVSLWVPDMFIFVIFKAMLLPDAAPAGCTSPWARRAGGRPRPSAPADPQWDTRIIDVAFLRWKVFSKHFLTPPQVQVLLWSAAAASWGVLTSSALFLLACSSWISMSFRSPSILFFILRASAWPLASASRLACSDSTARACFFLDGTYDSGQGQVNYETKLKLAGGAATVCTLKTGSSIVT